MRTLFYINIFLFIKLIKSAIPGATVNDVAITLCGGGLRRYLEAKGELPDSSLVAMAPINVRDPSEKGTAGNVVSAMAVLLRSDIADPAQRLAAVHEHAQEAKELANANGRIPAFNVHLRSLTGSHNNVVLLGSKEQAAGAIFYICPYMGKKKLPLAESLSILSHAVKHVQRNKSTAKDAGSPERNAKYLLQRVLNQMNLRVELCDYFIIRRTCYNSVTNHFKTILSGNLNTMQMGLAQMCNMNCLLLNWR